VWRYGISICCTIIFSNFSGDILAEGDRLRVIKTVCNEKPETETHWSIRTVAAKTGVGREKAHRILQSSTNYGNRQRIP